ncbi:MAG: hypothetical protein U0841_32205 [Chloroflexia bacterium]
MSTGIALRDAPGDPVVGGVGLVADANRRVTSGGTRSPLLATTVSGSR